MTSQTSNNSLAATATTISVQLPVMDFAPLVTHVKFAEMVGVTKDTVRGWVDKGFVPTIKVGKKRLINLAAITADALAMMNREQQQLSTIH